jgi:rfaE bifunctional protein nucleotidyltransferase chain/domain
MRDGKVLDVAGLAAVRERMEREGRRLVLTNGCFDILHAGHVRYLGRARRLGDALAVALNGDGSVRELKGEGRPVNPEADRAEVLSALEAVDHVVVFAEKRVTKVIEAVRPHVYAKGGDYTVASLDPEERAALEAAGTRIEILPLVPGRSTTAVLDRIPQK